MKIWGLLFAVLFCSGLCIAGLSGCGDDDDNSDCKPACQKIVSCAEELGLPIDFTVSACTDQCEHHMDSDTKCALRCDRTLDCTDYATCILDDCGIVFD
jgi:hypothetical protein